MTNNFIVVSNLYGYEIGKKQKDKTNSQNEITEEADLTAALSLWNDSAPAKKVLTDYDKAVTTEGSPDFIPEEDRIAVFDLDFDFAACCDFVAVFVKDFALDGVVLGGLFDFN